MSLVHVM